MAAAGAHVLIEDNFVSGPVSQQRWRSALQDTTVGWVGVHCEPAAAAAREATRGDRATGTAAQQAERVHRGISYDLQVDSSVTSPGALALVVRDHFWARPA